MSIKRNEMDVVVDKKDVDEKDLNVEKRPMGMALHGNSKSWFGKRDPELAHEGETRYSDEKRPMGASLVGSKWYGKRPIGEALTGEKDVSENRRGVLTEGQCSRLEGLFEKKMLENG